MTGLARKYSGGTGGDPGADTPRPNRISDLIET
jgi:hypothetical protein